MPISGLVVTFRSAIDEHRQAVEALRAIPEVEIGAAADCKLAIVVDSPSQHRDQEVWHTVQRLPGVVDVALAMVAFDDQDRC